MTDMTIKGNGTALVEESTNRQVAQIERIAGDIMRQAAEKLIEQSGANLQVAREALRMLEENHEALINEVRRLAECHAKRLSDYLTTVHLATAVMATHRESMMTIAQSIAADPVPGAAEGQ